MDKKIFIFNSEPVEIKAEKGEYIVEGYISTGDMDLVNDIVTKSGMDDMLSQLKNRNIKLDYEHETMIGESNLEMQVAKSKMPIGRIIDAEKDAKGIKVRAKLNSAWNKMDRKGNLVLGFKDVWKSIQDKFLDAFSIAYVPTRTKSKQLMDGKTARILDGVNLINVALTGNPINPAASMTSIMAKSVEFMESKGLEEESDEGWTELKYKYIKRTGTSGDYTYWYKDPKTGKVSEGKPKKDSQLTNRQGITMSIDNDVSAQDMADKFSPEQLKEIAETPGSNKNKITQARLLQEKKPKKESSKIEAGDRVKIERNSSNKTYKVISVDEDGKYATLSVNGQQENIDMRLLSQVTAKSQKKSAGDSMTEEEKKPGETQEEETQEEQTQEETTQEAQSEAEGKSAEKTSVEVKSELKAMAGKIAELEKKNADLEKQVNGLNSIMEKAQKKAIGTQPANEKKSEAKQVAGPLQVI